MNRLSDNVDDSDFRLRGLNSLSLSLPGRRVLFLFSSSEQFRHLTSFRKLRALGGACDWSDAIRVKEEALYRLHAPELNMAAK